MKNSNRKFFKTEWNIFENLNQQQVRQLCFADIAFTGLTGLLFLSKSNSEGIGQKIPGHLLLRSMKESLMLSQN
jgi:hypothetical protein